MTETLRFNLPVGQWAELDGALMRFVRRGRDRERRIVFEGVDGVPHDMTDRELLDLQHGDRRLRLLTEAEASDRISDAKRPRMILACSDDDTGDEARRRLDYVRGWERAGCPSRTERAVRPLLGAVFRERGERDAKPVERKPPSPRQVLRWVSDWVGSGGDIEALVPQTHNRGNTTDRLCPMARQLLERTVEDYYLVDTQPTAVSVHAQVGVAFETHNEALPVPDRLVVPSLRAVHRAIARIDLYTLECTRKGRRSADHRFRPVGSCPQTTRHNEVWEIDHTPVDAIVVEDGTGLPIGRPLVTVCLDRHTRAVVGFHIGFDPPGTHCTMECMRVCVLPKERLLASVPDIVGDWPCMGTPETLVPDQGKEFKSRAFVEACLTLGIDLQYTPVLKAWYKGKIERFFRTLTTDVFQRVPGTTFSNFFERNKEATPERVAIVTLDELRHHALRYIVDVYHRRRHRGLGVSPMEAWAESVRRNGMRPLPDPERVTTALSRVAYRVPQRYGIEFEGLIYNSADVSAYRVRNGAPRAVRIAVDPLDLTRIRFLDPADNRFVEVPVQESLRERVRGVTLEKHKLARALQRANPAALAGDAGLKRSYTLIDEAMRARGAATGLANRRDAARFWESLTKARTPEEPSAFDTAASGRTVTDGLFTELPNPHENVPERELEADDGEHEGERRKPPRKRAGRRAGTVADEAADQVPDAATPGDDLDAIALGMGMTVRRNGEAR